MGKFDGVLFFTDYDDTLYNTAHTVSPENHAAIRYFQANGRSEERRVGKECAA